MLPVIRQAANVFFFIVFIIILTGCSGKSDPVGGSYKGASSSSGTPDHPVLSKVIDITLDGQSFLGRGYSYGFIKPGVEHTFKADFALPLACEWKSGDVEIQSGSSGSGRSTEITFIPNRDKTEISISLDLAINGIDPVTMRWRIYVDSNPIQTEYIHPVYEKAIKYGVPSRGKQADVADNEFLVFFKPGVSRESVIRRIFNMECTILAEVPDLNLYRIYTFDKEMNTAEKLEGFASFDDVVYTQPDFILFPTVTPNDTYWDQKWDLRIMQADQAWDTETGDNTQTIAIIDTGIDRDHPDLAAKVTNGVDFISPPGDGLGGETNGDGSDNNGDGIPDQNVGHGTHCAGIAAGITNNGIGTAGVSWDSKLIPLRVFPTDGDSGATVDVLMAAYNWLDSNAISKNIIAANMSYGGFGGYSVQEQSIFTKLFDMRKVIMVAACGNSDWDADQHFPSAYDNVMSVAATNSSDVRASFSDYGTTVDVSAPGVEIRSTFYNDTYYDASGTSMASPEVTGLVGLVRAKWPSYTPYEVVDQIKFTTDNIDSLNPGYIGMLGTGRINAFKAVTQGLTPNLELVAMTADEDKIGWTDGNRDRLINSGEKCLLRLRVKNIGLSSANNVNATLEVNNPLVQIVKNTANLIQVTRGQTVTFDDYFLVAVSRVLPDESDVTFTFTLDDTENNGPWVYDQNITIYKNNLVTEIMDITGESIAPATVTKGQTDVALLKLNFSAQTNYTVIKNLTLTGTGTALNTAIDRVRLFLDRDGNGQYDGEGTEIEIGLSSYYNGSFFGDFDRPGDTHNSPFKQPIDEDFGDHVLDTGKKVTFHDVMIPAIDNISTTIFVVVDFNMSAVTNQTFGIGIMSAADINLMDGDTVNGTFPIQSDLCKILPTWMTETQLTFRDTAYTWRPEAAVDNLGYIHVVWDENNGDYNNSDFDIGYSRSTDQGATFETEERIYTEANHKSFYPDIAATSDGTLHIMFYDTVTGVDNREIFYMNSINHGISWTIPRPITEATGESRMARMYADGNTLHAAFHSNRDGSYDIYYFRSEDNGFTFTDPVQVNNSNRESEEVDLAVLNGDVHVCWQDVVKNSYGYVTDGRAMYAFSSDNGATFQTPQNLSDAIGGQYCYHTRCAIAPSGNVYVVFHSEAAGSFDVYMASGSDGTLAQAQRVTLWDDHGTGMPDIICDQNGRIDLFYDDTFERVTNVWHQYKEVSMTDWSEPARLSLNFTGDAQIPSAVKDSALNLYCFWQDNRAETGREEVWYNRMIY